MKKDHRKNMTGLQYRLILGIFILGFVLGLVLMIMTFDLRSFMTWAFILWEVLFAITIYCWVDEERYTKFEYYGIPVAFGLLFILCVLFAAGGLYFALQAVTGEEKSWSDFFGGMGGSACCGMYAYFAWAFYLRPYIKKDRDGKDD